MSLFYFSVITVKKKKILFRISFVAIKKKTEM